MQSFPPRQRCFSSGFQLLTLHFSPISQVGRRLREGGLCAVKALPEGIAVAEGIKHALKTLSKA